jgi:hypothetical protein
MGRHKAIETPELMLQYFTEYAEYCKSNPIKVHDFVGKDGDEVYRLRERPLTIEGFENYCYNQGVIGDLSHYFANTNNAYEEFLTICSRIRKTIRQDQIEGGMAGVYNPSITQRLNSLVEKSENKHEVSEIKITYDK